MLHLIKNTLFYLFQTRIFYSIWVCLRHLPFKQAIKVPILFYPGSKLRMGKYGKIRIEEELSFDQIKIGFGDGNFLKEGTKMTLIVEGLIIFKGENISICAGCNFHVTRTGIFTLHQNVVLAPMGRYFCCKAITIGKYTRIAHDCQMFDTNFHYLMNIETNEIKGSISAPIVIGENCWIGNRTTINARTKLPNGCVVASNSLLNKDYVKTVPPNSILAGIPAKKIAEGVTRVWDRKKEMTLYRELDKIEL